MKDGMEWKRSSTDNNGRIYVVSDNLTSFKTWTINQLCTVFGIHFQTLCCTYFSVGSLFLLVAGLLVLCSSPSNDWWDTFAEFIYTSSTGRWKTTKKSPALYITLHLQPPALIVFGYIYLSSLSSNWLN